MATQILDRPCAVFLGPTAGHRAALATPQLGLRRFGRCGQVFANGLIKTGVSERAFNAQIDHSQVRGAMGPGRLDRGGNGRIQRHRFVLHGNAGVDRHHQVH